LQISGMTHTLNLYILMNDKWPHVIARETVTV
jgi:hypothetical protein